MTKFTGNRKFAILFSLLSIGWIVALFIESSQPPAEFIGAMEGLDKVAHFIAFGVLALLVCAVSFSLSPKPSILIFSMPLLLVMLTGVVEEGYQMTIPGRAGSVQDLLADFCGAAFAIIMAKCASLIIRSRHRIRGD